MKIFAFMLIIAGTIGSAVTAAHIPPLWLEFTIFLIITGAGLYLKRKKSLENYANQNNSVNPLNQFKILIDEQLNYLTGLVDNDIVKIDLLKNCQIEHLYNRVEQIRVGIINQLGMKKYISIISPFARAERLLYRGYSSAIDGYDEEAKQSIKQSLEFFKITNEELNRILEA
jgi:hypothetical protein